MNAGKNAILSLLARTLPTRVKNSLLHVAFNLSPVEFQKFSYLYHFAPNMALGLMDLKKRGFSPKTIVDVGAFQGDWSNLARQIWPESKAIMIEPNLAKQPKVSETADQLGAILFDDLIGAEDGRVVEFNVMESGSSVMSERSSLPRTVESRRLRTLDSVLNGVSSPVLLKIDAQGYELEILRGAVQSLPTFEGILLEIAVIEINEGAPLLHDVIAYMKSAGFVTYDILEIHRRPLDGALNQVDIFFVREESFLIMDKRHFA